jgi:hypothetical protein
VVKPGAIQASAAATVHKSVLHLVVGYGIMQLPHMVGPHMNVAEPAIVVV